jgi:hypothetical protein
VAAIYFYNQYENYEHYRNILCERKHTQVNVPVEPETLCLFEMVSVLHLSLICLPDFPTR